MAEGEAPFRNWVRPSAGALADHFALLYVSAKRA